MASESFERLVIFVTFCEPLGAARLCCRKTHRLFQQKHAEFLSTGGHRDHREVGDRTDPESFEPLVIFLTFSEPWLFCYRLLFPDLRV